MNFSFVLSPWIATKPSFNPLPRIPCNVRNRQQNWHAKQSVQQWSRLSLKLFLVWNKPDPTQCNWGITKILLWSHISSLTWHNCILPTVHLLLAEKRAYQWQFMNCITMFSRKWTGCEGNLTVTSVTSLTTSVD